MVEVTVGRGILFIEGCTMLVEIFYSGCFAFVALPDQFIS